ncbi:unnamed protein product [Vitrella brassicaformis CCMP3155]|uniref:Thioredoxin domain-containing protein n=1 Tax=Vitrella brassicaformis (strain CCMP3155) TaxID=1169540 RepID=A0A0G4EGV6_VITBC|nr:unnamed protein product [Vitrella brassicaformis CCMP3155]|eukprot:CEL95477.1 unnamed protein product [Vitrella brassicaformis CCMP3155]
MALLLGKSVNDDGAAAAREREREAAVEALNVERRENMRVALGSGLGGALLYGGQRLNPLRADPLVILREMERDSPPVDAQLFTNGRPTVIDFYAPWCENCKTMAPSMRTIEKEYSGRVNFVTVDGSRSDTSSQRLVQRFRVDAIPHIALVSARGEILTALIGLIPKEVLKADFDALLSDRPLPYIGYDAFDGDVTRSAVDQGW